MTTTQDTVATRNKISKILVKWGMPTRQAAIAEIMQEVAQVAEVVRRETIEEAVLLSDEIEMRVGTNENFEEWRAFKGFRNTLRDRLAALEAAETKPGMVK